MIRKQLYLHEAQDRALKRRARESGLSEAALVRQALDATLWDEHPAGQSAERASALDDLLENARRISRKHRLPSGYRFEREELYGERAAGWNAGS